ncbi:hypothetical protein Prudu_016860, partial [Prunus dulcis]
RNGEGLAIYQSPDQLCEGCLRGNNLEEAFVEKQGQEQESHWSSFMQIRKTWVYFLKEKYEVFGSFKKFKVYVENVSGCKIKALRSGRGGEFTSKEFHNFCEDHGIRRYLTVPYHPQQNGVVERKK